jgi:signal transduction histidine kinase
MTKKELTFSIDSQLLGELGERLVTKNYIALSELVKNGYDADASWVKIRFINAKKAIDSKNISEIQVIDSGHGMTLSDIENFFMRVATANKLENPYTRRFGRKKTGKKGIGRFACRKLAFKLIIETVALNEQKNKKESSKFTFDWKVFKPGSELSEIKIDVDTIECEKCELGTKLRLVGLTDSWSDSDFRLLKRNILTLSRISESKKRKGFEKDPGFDVFFETPEFPEGSGKLSDQIFEGGWGTLDGIIKEDGTAHLTLSAKGIDIKPYDIPKSFDKIKGVSFKIAWIPMNKEYYKNPNLLTYRTVSDLMEEQHGVKVYYDGFRVFPLGDPDDDWLGLAKFVALRGGKADPLLQVLASDYGFDPSRVLLNHPTNKNLIGLVEINSDITDTFQIKLNREGFVDNEAYSQLIDFIRLSIQWMVIHYNRFLTIYTRDTAERKGEDIVKQIERVSNIEQLPLQDNIPITIRPKDLQAPTPSKALEYLSTEAKKAYSNFPESERKDLVKFTNRITEYVDYSFKHYSSMLGAVASTGAIMFVFAHEVKGIGAKLESEANKIENLIEKIPKNERKDLLDLANSLRESRDRLDQNIKLFGFLTKQSAENQPKEIALLKMTNEIVNNFDYLFSHYELKKPQIDIPELLRTKPMLEADIYSVLINLLSNAVKAVIAGNGKNILIFSRKEHGKLIIRIYDDGIGLSEENREKVFEPLLADPDKKLYENLNIRLIDKDLISLGQGTGLGLSIVRIIVEKYGGKAKFIDTDHPWKTCIEVTIP